MQEVVNFFSWSSNEFFGQNIGEKLEYSHNGGACNGTGAAVGGDIFVECAELSLMPSRTQHISMPLQLQIVHGTWPVVPQLSRNVILSYLQLLKMIYWIYEFIRAYFYFPRVPMIVFTSIPCHVPLSFDHSKPRSGFWFHIFLAHHILRKKYFNKSQSFTILHLPFSFICIVIYFHYLLCLLITNSLFYSKAKEF